MGFLDKAKDLAGKHADKVDSAIGKAGDVFDEKTGGKHAQHTDKVQDKVGDYLTGDKAQNPEPGA